MVEVCYGAVVKEIQDADTSECLRYDVGEDRRGGACIHGREASEYIVELGEGVDENEDIGCFEC